MPLAGEQESGDMFVLRDVPGGALIGAVDALGHGPDAASAARLAIAILEEYASEPLATLMRRCHERLAKTRGVVAALAAVDVARSSLRWLAIGNIEALIVHRNPALPSASILQHPGVLGYKLPNVPSDGHAARLLPGDRIAFATDGVRASFADDVRGGEPLPELAGLMVERHSKGTDDALVLMAEYDGDAA